MAYNSIEAKKYNAGFYSTQMDGSYNSALKVLPIIDYLLHPQSVLDIGCGVGSWLKAWKDINPNIDVVGIDGNYVAKEQLLIDPVAFVAKDIKEEIDLNRQFDFVMSLEVGEHLPTSQSEMLVRNLIRHGRYVLFSAAIPYQQGTFHINEQFPEFWAQIFKKYEFYPVDLIRNKIWNDAEVEWWYRQNIILYVHKSQINQNSSISKYYEFTDASSLTRIHPQLWIYHNEDYKKATKSFLSFTKWKLSMLKKKFFK